MLSIKNASVADIPLIRELTYKIWPKTYSPILSGEQIDYMLEMMYSISSLEQQMFEGHSFILCFDDNAAVGFASYAEIEPGIYKLHKIYVLPGLQGKGIGHFMLKHITGDIKSKDAKALDLNVNKYNKQAHSFYEKHGFVVTREEDIDIGRGYFMNDYVMRLSLNKGSSLQ